MTVEETSTYFQCGVLLPEGWGWLFPDPAQLREGLGVMLEGASAEDREAAILKAIDEVLALRSGLAPWQPAAVASWVQPAVIGGLDEILTASLVLALSDTGRAVDAASLAADISASARQHQTDVQMVKLDFGDAVVSLERWPASEAAPPVRLWLYAIPITDLGLCALLAFVTPDEPGWESFGDLFRAMADTFHVYRTDEVVTRH